MANRNKGREDIFKPFGKRRHRPGTNAGQARVGYSDASLAMTQARSLPHAAAIAINKFGVPRKWVRMVMLDDKRNNVKLMRLVTLCKRFGARKRARADLSIAKARPGAKHGAQDFRRSLDALDLRRRRVP